MKAASSREAGARSAKPRPLERFKRSASAPGEVHLLGGQWKRSRLPVADVAGLRPTPVRIRQTLFDWLSHWWASRGVPDSGEGLAGCRVVDAFAGSGALGFEAASRGASPVLMVDADAGLVRRLGEVAARLKADRVTVRRGDGVAALRGLAAASVDLVLLDPPFDSALALPALAAARRALAAGGRVHLEFGSRLSDERLAAEGWLCIRHRAAGAVHAHLLQRLEEGSADEALPPAAPYTGSTDPLPGDPR